MPTFPDDPDDKAAYEKPFVNPNPLKSPSVTYVGIRPFPDGASDEICRRIKFVTDQIPNVNFPDYLKP